MYPRDLVWDTWSQAVGCSGDIVWPLDSVAYLTRVGSLSWALKAMYVLPVPDRIYFSYLQRSKEPSEGAPNFMKGPSPSHGETVSQSTPDPQHTYLKLLLSSIYFVTITWKGTKTRGSFYRHLCFKRGIGCWVDGSAVKSPCYSSRDPEFSSQHSHRVAHNYL